MPRRRTPISLRIVALALQLSLVLGDGFNALGLRWCPYHRHAPTAASRPHCMGEMGGMQDMAGMAGMPGMAMAHGGASGSERIRCICTESCPGCASSDAAPALAAHAPVFAVAMAAAPVAGGMAVPRGRLRFLLPFATAPPPLSLPS
jgi:hypothetical protein